MQPANLYRPRCSVAPRSRQICPQADSYHQRTLACKSADHGPISGCLNPGYDSGLGQKLSNSLTQPITRAGRKAFRNTYSIINSSTSPSASPQPPHAVIRQRNPYHSDIKQNVTTSTERHAKVRSKSSGKGKIGLLASRGRNS